jgi:dolichol-phosphate mannosyltransferase
MTYFYDIHSLLTIASDVVLPELAAFSQPADGPDRATLRVRVRPWAGRRPAPLGDDTVVHDEGLGGLGFAVRVALGERIEVEASPLLRHSPHVLYTYVVEPILRWTFLQKGCALVHAACVGSAGDAYLITARTDIGKTATLLTLLRRYPKMAFLSDDLCLVRSDGGVLAYPKPLTISQHTLHAVNPRALSLAERAALVVQSRVHSRSGRRLARLLARTGLPVATIDALAQWLIPPPRYSVERLLPYAELAGGARLRGLFLIERGATDDTRALDHETAMEVLADNSEDAFGSPPCPTLELRLRHRGDLDWRDREREIVAAAFDGLPATLLSSSRLDWWRRIATSIETSTARARRMAIAVASA